MERLYRMRTAIERVNSRLKEFLGLRRITVRGIVKVTVRSVLSLLVMLAIGVLLRKDGPTAQAEGVASPERLFWHPVELTTSIFTPPDL